MKLPFAGLLAVRRAIPLWVAATVILVSCCLPHGLPGGTPSGANNVVRGYLAVAVGNSASAKSGGLFSQQIEGKAIFLPGIKVHLEDTASGRRSEAVTTDLSGRFTLFAPTRSEYRICWHEKAFEAGCTRQVFAAGQSPQFVSTVDIPIPSRLGTAAVMGHVSMADGTSPRTLDPMLNINAFATVDLIDSKGHRQAHVSVNNFGDYVIPYVPTDERVRLVASIEQAKVEQEIWPEALLKSARLHQANLKFTSPRPVLDPLIAFEALNNRRAQNPAAGSMIKLNAHGRSAGGGAVNYAWFVDTADGQLSANNGASVQWTLPSTPGHYTVTAVAFDNKGGYDKAVLTLQAGAPGIAFTGVVVEPSGTPVANAQVEIVGNPAVQTDATGRFQTFVAAADRYVLNIRKLGYSLNSKVYDHAMAGGRWVLVPGQIVTIDPTRDIKLQHRRPDNACVGPDVLRGNPGPAGNSLYTPQWQDGHGQVIDAATISPEHRSFLTPSGLKLPGCGPGVEVAIPANAIVDANGNLVTAPIQVTLGTIDVLSPQQMPGDDMVVPLGGGGAYLESFGAGSLDLPVGFKLKAGAVAQFTIPVDRSKMTGQPLPATVPLLSYDETQGLWREDGQLSLITLNGRPAYTAKVKHFTTYNADTFFGSSAACVRVFSPGLPGQYDLEVMSPYPDGTPHYKKYGIDNASATEHVIYNITPNVNITLAPMTQGATPQLLGFYVVNSGRPQSPSNSPNSPPLTPDGYTSCQNFVILKVGNAPDSPFGGEFLTGLGFLNAVNLGFDDLTSAGPTGNALRDAIVGAAKNYYLSVDPNSDRDTLDKFKAKHGFGTNPNLPAAGEIVAQYANSGDLGFGRDMHCLNKANGDVACYVTNYGSGYSNVYSVPPAGTGSAGPGTSDADDAQAAGTRSTVGASSEVATVAMEYAAIEGDLVGDKVVKFFVYKKGIANARSISANLDGRGERPVPQLCMVCHGGLVPNQANGVPSFGTAAQVKLNSRFLPFDHRFFAFPSVPALSKANQEAAFKSLNQQIVNATLPATHPIRDVISGMYAGGVTTQIYNFTVPGWLPGAGANAPNQDTFYRKVVANDCRNCHITQAFDQLQFDTSQKLVNLGSGQNQVMLGAVQLRVCGDYTMPHALRTHDIFWDSYWDVASWGAPPTPASADLENFGGGIGGNSWKPGQCTSFVSPNASPPIGFYEQVVQPIWNAKCVQCHVGSTPPGSLPLTEGDSFSALHSSGRIAPGNDADTSAKLLQRITGAVGVRMPQGCIPPPTVPGPGQLGCLPQTDIDKIKAWIRSGAN